MEPCQAEQQAKIFEEKMNDLLNIIEERVVENNQELIKLLEKLFGEGMKEEKDKLKPIEFSGIAGTWLTILRNIDGILIESNRILRRIHKEFK